MKNNFYWKFSFLLAIILGWMGTDKSQAQCPTSVCSTPSTIGLFKVDGQVRTVNPFDDWFDVDGNPATGLGVISDGPSAAAGWYNGISSADFNAILLSHPNRNLTFVQRMSVGPITPVPANPLTGDGFIMLDAVAARDNHTAGSANDSSAFASGTDKNGANPNTWNIGIAGVPQKNDLIDVGGHIRRMYNFATNTPGSLVGYAYATTRNTSGDSYLDFEIYRTAPVISGTSFTNTGPDGGHSATRFTPGGLTLAQPGDLLVSIDYANGGASPCASVRVWIDPDNVDGNGMDTATYNQLPVANRIYTFTGVFDGGSGSGTFGYAEIVPKNGFSPSTCLFAAVTNISSSPTATAWGNLSSSSAAYSTTFEPLQLVEVAIDFSAFGLDIDPVSGPCFNLFGSLVVKSRSSTSFTSELKDFSGPHIFGNFQEVNADAGDDMNLSCNISQLTLMGSSSTPGATYLWTVVPGSGGSIVSGANTLNPVVDSAGTYVLTVSNPVLASCVATDTTVVVGEPDFDPPVVTCMPDINRTCVDDIPAPPTDVKSFKDQGGSASDISGPITLTSSDVVVTPGSCNGQINRIFTLADNCGNTTTCTQTININDIVPPFINNGPADEALGCNPAIPAADVTTVTATDNCGGVTITVLPDVITGDCFKTLVRTYIATDVCGNTASFNQTITYKTDSLAPLITTKTSGGDIGCNPTAQQIEDGLGGATVIDDCDQSLTANENTSAPIINGCLYSQTRTFTAVDVCGNSATAASVTVTWTVDLTAPVITLDNPGAPTALGCNPTTQAIENALGTASVNDGCGTGALLTSSDSPVSGTPCARSQTRTWEAVDPCGNTATTVTRTVTWKEDTQAATITLDSAPTLNGCNPSNNDIDAALGTATAVDDCDGNQPATFTDSNGQNGCQSTRTRTFTYTDACGNTSVAVTRTVSWTADQTPPVITLVGPIGPVALGCNPSAQDIEDALGTATASDACGTFTPNSNDITTGPPCARVRTRTWNVADGCGNSATTVSRTVTWTEDSNAPVITLDAAPALSGCNPTSSMIEAALGTATVNDDCDGTLAAPFTDSDNNNGCQFSRTRTFNYTDGCGNTATTVTRTVSWSADQSAPVITLVGPVGPTDLGCNPSAQQIEDALGSATVADNCGPLTPLVNDITTGPPCARVRTRTWTVADACGNSATAVSRVATWKEDNTAPVINLVGPAGPIDMGCNPASQDIESALGSVTVTDDCDNLIATFSDDTTQNGCNYSIVRTWNVTDPCGQVAQSVSRTVNYRMDTTAPIVSCGASSSVIEFCDNGTNTVSFNPSASDNCDGTLTPVVNRSDGQSLSDPFPLGTTTVTVTATDLCGNSSTCVTTVSVYVNPTCNIAPPANNPACGSVGNTLTATINNAASYSWSVTTNVATATPWVITDGANTPTITYTAGSGSATFTLTLINGSAASACTTQCQVTVSCIDGRFCTYTQGYYGNRGGMSCAGVTTTPLLNLLLGGGNDLTVGMISTSRSVTFTQADVGSGCFYRRLPGGGPNRLIEPGNHDCSSVPTTMLKRNGSLNNVLLSQTITLGLNLRIPGSSLSGLQITAPYLLTYASDSSGCVSSSAAPVPGTELVRTIPQSVITYLGTSNTVGDLFVLANRALGGDLPPGAPHLSAINRAVSAFNEAFDECRFFGGFYPTDPLMPAVIGTREIHGNEDVAVMAYPNPVSDLTNIEFMLNGYDSDVVIEVFNLNGARMDALFNATADSDIPYRVQVDVSQYEPGVYFYHINSIKGVYTGKITVIR